MDVITIIDRQSRKELLIQFLFDFVFVWCAKDEPFDRFSQIKPFNRDGHGNNKINLYKNDDDDTLLLRTLDGYERTLANAYRLLGGDEYRRRFFMDRNNFNNAPYRSQQQAGHIKEETQQQLNDQHELKRAVDSLGGANLLKRSQFEAKRAVDSLGGANLLKRAVDRIGGGNLLR